MRALSAVRPRTEELRRIDYLLKLSLRTQDIHQVQAWHFANARAAALFEDAATNKQVLHAWLDPSTLDSTNALDALAERGFVFSQYGMKFDTGTVNVSSSRAPVPPSFSMGGGSQSPPKRLILCQIAVGRCYVQDDPELVPKPPPEGFDAVFLARPSKAGEFNPDVYRHEYVLYDPKCALPMYLVQFFDGPAPTDGSSSLPALLMDTNQNNTLSPHTNEAQIQALYDRYDFFDPILYVPVSVRDKMVGSHSTGESAQHKLIGVGDAYDAAVSESLKPDPILAERQVELRANLRAVDAKLHEVNRNATMLEDQIYKALQDALFQLQEATQERMNVLLSEEVELRRQLQHIDWIETFLDRQREEATPVDFLNAWKCHVQLRGDLCRNALNTHAVVDSVHADLELVGQVSIVSSGGGPIVTHGLSPIALPTSGGGPARGGGVGSMMMQGTPPTVQPNHSFLSAGSGGGLNLNAPSPPNRAPPPQQQQQYQQSYGGVPTNGGLDGGQVDIARAWAEAVREQTMEQTRKYSTAGGTGNTSNSGRFGSEADQQRFYGQEEIPPTPPVVPKPKSIPTTSAGGRTPDEFALFSLSADAVRRLRKSNNKLLKDQNNAFPSSQLLSHGPMREPPAQQSGGESAGMDDLILSEAQALYLSLPIHGMVRSGSRAPQTRLLFASWTNQASNTIAELLKSMPKYVQRDAEGNEMVFPEPCQTVLIVRANGRRFGGYASAEWRDDGKAFGDATSFLFSLDLDIKIPFHGREPVEGERAPNVRFPAMISDETALKFGNGDLVFANDFLSCTSELEHSFGVGMVPGSGECRTFLAGSERFQCDAWELWQILQ